MNKIFLNEILKDILVDRLQSIKLLKENLIIGDAQQIRKGLIKMFSYFVKMGYIQNYHQGLTSGDMNPADFIEDFADVVINDLERQIQKINDRGDKYNRQGIEHPSKNGVISGDL